MGPKGRMVGIGAQCSANTQIQNCYLVYFYKNICLRRKVSVSRFPDILEATGSGFPFPPIPLWAKHSKNDFGKLF